MRMEYFGFYPEQHGYRECDHCHGYGSSLEEESDTCTKCGGSGLELMSHTARVCVTSVLRRSSAMGIQVSVGRVLTR